jgi:hypothetical protein
VRRKNGDARNCWDVGAGASWCADDERALALVLLFGGFGWGEDARTVGEWGQEREWDRGEGGVRIHGPFCLHLRVAVVGENAEWEGE